MQGPEGDPVAGLTVYAHSEGRDMRNRFSDRTRTDAEGAFEFTVEQDESMVYFDLDTAGWDGTLYLWSPTGDLLAFNTEMRQHDLAAVMQQLLVVKCDFIARHIKKLVGSFKL